MIVDDLSVEQIEQAFAVALEQAQHVRKHKIRQYYGRTDRRHARLWDLTISKQAECGVAHKLRIPWPNRTIEDEFTGAGDVGGIIEVRARPIPGPGPDLGIRPIDVEERAGKPFVLVHWHWQGYFMDIIGYAWPEEAVARGQWSDISGCWFLRPPLHPFEDLIAFFSDYEAAA